MEKRKYQANSEFQRALNKIETRCVEALRIYKKHQSDAFSLLRHNCAGLATVVKGNVQIAAETPNKREAKKRLAIASKLLPHLEKLSQKMSQHHPRAVPLSVLRRRVENEIGPRLLLSPDQLRITTNGNFRQIALMHEPAIFESIVELVFNAVKSHREIGREDLPIEIHLEVNTSLNKRSKRKKRLLQVQIRDRGGGMSRNEVERMLHKSRLNRGLQGVGSVVKAHQGRYTIRSAVGHGLTAEFQIPLRSRMLRELKR